MKPFRFGPPGRQLFACYHPPVDRASRKTAVLICNPFGQEAIRAHRMLKLVADRIAKSGYPVLRFDYLGTGDSDGDCLQVSPDGCRMDVLAAALKLRELSATPRTAWIGFGLGARIAAGAASAGASVDALILCDPVTDGAAYLRRLRTVHAKHVRAYVPRAFALEHVATPRDAATGFAEELIGFPVTSDYVEFIRSADRLPGSPLAVRRVVALVPDVDDPAVGGLARWCGPQTAFEKRPIRSWTEAQFNDIIASGVVYGDIADAIVLAVSELS